MFLFLLLPIVVFWKALTRVYRAVFIIYLIVLANFQDINFNIPSNNENTSTFKLLSLNMGGGSAGKYLKTLMTRENPDVFLFQETSLQNIDDAFDSSWNYQCDKGLCIASKFSFKKCVD